MANWETQSATREYNVTPNGELTVVERLASLLETGQFADVEINVGTGKDAQKFKAHRILLATASQPLSNLLTGADSHEPGETVRLNVTDIDPESFHHILRYIYTDDVNIASISEAIDLVKCAEKWGLEPLGKKSVKFMHQYLDEYEPTSEDYKNDLCDLLIFSEDEEDKLNMRCWEVMLKNVNEVIPCQSFLNMSEETITKLLTHHDFKYKNQLNLFEAIRDWGMNQVLEKQLPVTKLQSVIGRLLKHIKMDGIKDDEFVNTVLPSDCLDKADLISYFMSRGLEIPRDLAFNSSGVKSNRNRQGISSDYEKATRFKKGYKIQGQEIYREHELRFRVDTDVILYGVAFGFLFSNIDMGITVHCQGPWETNQWSDIVQILVRIGRMSAGPSEVDLWGGGEGDASVKTDDAVFHFLKNAVPPSKQVEEKDKDHSNSMITKLIYEIEGKEKPIGLGNLSMNPSTPSESNSPVQPSKTITPSIAPATPIVSPSSPTPFSTSTILPKPYSPCSSPIPKPFSPVRGPLTPVFPVSPPLNLNSQPTQFNPVSVPVLQHPTAHKPTQTDSPPQSPLQIRKLKIPDTTPKKSYITQLTKLNDPEPPWTKRKNSLITTDDGKAPVSPFRVGKDVPEAEPRSLPWQRKSSLTKKEELPSFTLKPRSNIYSKTITNENPPRSWEIPSKYKPASSSYNYSSAREPSLSRTTREPSRTREYTPLSTRTDYSRYGASRLGNSYNFSTPYSSYKNPGLSTSTRASQISKAPQTNNAYTPLGSSGSSSINKNTSSNPYTSNSRPYGAQSSVKASSPAPFSSNFSKYNPSSRSTHNESSSLNKFGKSFDTPSSKYGSTTPKDSVTGTSRYGAAKDPPTYSRYGSNSTTNSSGPSKYGSTSATDNPGTSRYGYKYSQPELSTRTHDSTNESSAGSPKFGRKSTTYKPMSSIASRLGESNFNKESSPYSPNTRRTSYSRPSLYPSHVDSVKSRFSGGSGTSNSYSRR